MAVGTTAPRSVGGRIIDVRAQQQRDRGRFWVVYGALITFVLITAAIAVSTAPEAFSIAFGVLVMASVACFVRPTIGVYVIVTLTLIGDTVTTSWWPFTKNLSSRESIFYVHDSIPINPLEILLVVTTISWLLERLDDPTWRFKRGGLLAPLLVFSGTVVFAILRTVGTGADKRIAFFEARPLLYVGIVYLLITNLLTTRQQYVRLLFLALTAISIQSIFSLVYYQQLPPDERENLESLSEHSATVLMDMLLVFLLAVLMLKCSRWMRWAVALMAPPVLWAYLLSQRRAAMVAMFIGVTTLVIILYHRRRRAFWFFTPATVILGLGFVLATWNSSGVLGLPATAVKSVLFPDQLAEADQSSDLYRQIEAYDIWFTIHSNPIFGVGFGQKFLQVIPLPDISFFEFWEYIPHNSVLWIWMKLGFFGFAALLYLFARAVQFGARSAMQVRSGDHVAVTVAGLSYVVMFLVFAYVDIAWDPRSTVFLGVALALCVDFAQAEDAPPVHVGPAHFEMVPQ
jgi:hypothetical protein